MALGGELAIRMSFDFDKEPTKFKDGINMIKKEIDTRLGIVRYTALLYDLSSNINDISTV